MTTDRQLIKIALEALELNLPIIEDFAGKEELTRQHKAIASLYEALRTRLAEPEEKYTYGTPLLDEFIGKQPVQEPVAWLSDDGNVMFGPGPKGKFIRPLYTHPLKPHYSNTDNPVDFPNNESQLQPVWNAGPTNQDYEEAMRIKRLNKLTKREWQGLTDEEIAELYIKWDKTPGVSMADFSRAIEDKLKEKNT
jgi:hypothetical protein